MQVNRRSLLLCAPTTVIACEPRDDIGVAHCNCSAEMKVALVIVESCASSMHPYAPFGVKPEPEMVITETPLQTALDGKMSMEAAF